jgi:oligoribonuclease NrnB/cAMP/cGMP phosphodiesterase (DHH superfamily)
MNTIIYHSADYDGIFCREIAKRFLGKDNTFLGWNFGDPLVPFPQEGTCYVLDLPPDCLQSIPIDNSRLIWIDHHKTSIEKWTPDVLSSEIVGYRIDGVAACRLAWQWFNLVDGEFGTGRLKQTLPTFQHFKDRQMEEPLAVRLAGEYDIWDKRDPDADTFQYALRIYEPNWNLLLNDATGVVEDMLSSGRICQKYAQHVDESVCKTRTWLMQWEGLNFLCVNTARFNSQFFASRDIPETGHDALLGCNFNGKMWTVSLYHAKHRTDLDLSEIAKKNGGGGHRGACGFTCAKLPFLP